MARLRIEGFLWSNDSERHIGRHMVLPGEVEEAAYAAGLIVGGRGRDVYEVYGQTEAGRYLLVVIRVVERVLAYVITAREMTRTERRRYQRYILN